MSQIKEVKDATDIVALISARVTLQRSGSYYRGLCPFHSEKGPSFFVDDVLQRYKCFGCGESGDAFTFLQKYEGMTFGEALESLAQDAGITLQQFTHSAEDTLREDMSAALSLAKQYYNYILTEHSAGQIGRDYLKQRGTTAESIRVFQLGYALEEWDGLLQYLHYKKKYPIDILLAAGLIIQGKNGRYYDRFRGRIMFPLTDARGKVVGFSGRKVLSPVTSQAAPAAADAEAKYINSPETLLYHKSKMLFGFSELYQEIRKAKQVVVVEGEFDVISSTQAHMNAIVAIKGSALTAEHAQLLARTVETVCLALDSDSAGVAATKKAIQALKNTTIQLKVVEIPSGKDPDELIRTDPKAWRQSLKASMSAHEFLIKTALKQNDPQDPQGKRAIMQTLLPILTEIEHSVEQEHYARLLAQELGVQLESVLQDIKHYTHKSKLLGVTQPARAPKTSREETDVASQSAAAPSAQERLERYVLFLLFALPPVEILEGARKLVELDFELVGARHIMRSVVEQSKLFSQVATDEDTDAATTAQNNRQHSAQTPQQQALRRFAQTLPSDLQETLFEICTDQEYLSNFETVEQRGLAKEFALSYKKVTKEATGREIARITQRLGELDEIDNKTTEQLEEHERLLREVVQLHARLKHS